MDSGGNSTNINKFSSRNQEVTVTFRNGYWNVKTKTCMSTHSYNAANKDMDP